MFEHDDLQDSQPVNSSPMGKIFWGQEVKWPFEEIEYPSYEMIKDISLIDNTTAKEANFTLEDLDLDKNRLLKSRSEKLKEDVIKKSLLRIIKRFYHRIFIKENHRLARKRFKNVKFSEIYEAAQRLVKKHFKIEEDKEDLALFIAKIIGLNSLDKPKSVGKVDKISSSFKILVTSFSNPRFNKIQDSYYFKEILNYIVYGTLPDSGIPCYDYMLEVGGKTINKDLEKYKEIFLNIVKRCQ